MGVRRGALRDAVGPARVQGRRYFRHARGGLAPGHRLDGAPRVDARVGAASDSAVSRSGRQATTARHRRSTDRAGRSHRTRRRSRGRRPRPRAAAAPVATRDSRCALRDRGRCARERGNGVPHTVAGAPRRHSIPVHARRGPVAQLNWPPSGRHLAGRRADGLCGASAALPPIHVGARGSPDRRTSFLRRLRDESRVFTGQPVSGLLVERRPDAQKSGGRRRGSRDDLSRRPTAWRELGHGRDRIRPAQQRHHARVRERRYTGNARKRERRRRGVQPSDPARWRDRAVHACHRHRPRAVGQGADRDALIEIGRAKDPR